MIYLLKNEISDLAKVARGGVELASLQVVCTGASGDQLVALDAGVKIVEGGELSIQSAANLSRRETRELYVFVKSNSNIEYSDKGYDLAYGVNLSDGTRFALIRIRYKELEIGFMNGIYRTIAIHEKSVELLD